MVTNYTMMNENLNGVWINDINQAKASSTTLVLERDNPGRMRFKKKVSLQLLLIKLSSEPSWNTRGGYI